MSERTLCLFAGIGGTALGQLSLGNEIAGLVEWDATAANTLRANFGGHPVLEGDVRSIDFAGTVEADIVIGGPPCQPFSQGANNDGEYDKRDMIPEFIRAVREVQPRLFIMEEVQTLTWQRHRAYLERVLADLRDLGYVVDYRVLNMADYGIPQARKRLFVIGRRDGEVAWPEKLDRPVTMAEALGWDEEICRQRNGLTPKPGGDYTWPLRRPSTTVVGSFRPEVQSAPGYRKAGDGPRQNTPGSVVTTLTEALVLQGLPPDWTVTGTEARQRLQVGNSCPPQMTALLTRVNTN